MRSTVAPFQEGREDVIEHDHSALENIMRFETIFSKRTYQSNEILI